MKRQIEELNISYAIEGSGPPLVLLHGAGADMISWEEMVPHLAQDFTVYVYDQRGFGETERPASPVLSMDVWTQDLLNFLDAFELDAPTLAGWSLGGCVALNFACEYPTRCSALIAIGTRGPNRESRDLSGFLKRQELAESGATAEQMIDATFDFTRAAFSQWSRDHNRHSLSKTREMLIRNNPSDYAETVRAMDGLSDFGPKLPMLRAPTLVLCGTEDGRTPPLMSEALHRAIPGSQLVMIPDCGHYYPYEKPLETSNEITRFLKSL